MKANLDLVFGLVFLTADEGVETLGKHPNIFGSFAGLDVAAADAASQSGDTEQSNRRFGGDIHQRLLKT